MRHLLLLSLFSWTLSCAADDKPGDKNGGAGTPAGVPAGLPVGPTAGTPGPTTPLAQPVCDLLLNPGAEDGLTGWTVEAGDVQSIGVGNQVPVPWGDAAQFWMGQVDWSVAVQEVDLSAWRAQIDAGGVVAHLQAQVRDWNGNDEVFLGLTAVDADGNELDARLDGPFTDEAWRMRRVHLALPLGTAAVQVRMGGARNQGTDNDAYVDALSLCIDQEAPPALPSPTVGPWLTWVETDAISVLWETDSAFQGSVEWGRADGGWEGVVDEAGSAEHHEVRLTGLEPDTVYRYRIRFQDQAGEIFHSFRTAPAISVPIRFAVWGDNQDGPDTFAEVVDRMEALDPDFAVAVGDVVQTGTENNWRDQLLDPILDLTLDTPMLVAAGNHERLLDGNASLFDLHLAQPGDEHCFGWTYSGVYFLFIDTENPVDSGAQATCIADALASAEFAASDVQIALFHYPPRIEFWAFWTFDGITPYDGDPEVRDVLEPQFEAAGVDLVINGHNHLYAWTPPGTYSSVAWVTTGGGGGDIDSQAWVVGDWTGITHTDHGHHFLHIQVDGKQLEAQAVAVDGTEIHSFSVTAD